MTSLRGNIPCLCILVTLIVQSTMTNATSTQDPSINVTNTAAESTSSTEVTSTENSTSTSTNQTTLTFTTPDMDTQSTEVITSASSSLDTTTSGGQTSTNMSSVTDASTSVSSVTETTTDNTVFTTIETNTGTSPAAVGPTITLSTPQSTSTVETAINSTTSSSTEVSKSTESASESTATSTLSTSSEANTTQESTIKTVTVSTTVQVDTNETVSISVSESTTKAGPSTLTPTTATSDSATTQTSSTDRSGVTTPSTSVSNTNSVQTTQSTTEVTNTSRNETTNDSTDSSTSAAGTSTDFTSSSITVLSSTQPNKTPAGTATVSVTTSSTDAPETSTDSPTSSSSVSVTTSSTDAPETSTDSLTSLSSVSSTMITGLSSSSPQNESTTEDVTTLPTSASTVTTTSSTTTVKSSTHYPSKTVNVDSFEISLNLTIVNLTDITKIKTYLNDLFVNYTSLGIELIVISISKSPTRRKRETGQERIKVRVIFKQNIGIWKNNKSETLQAVTDVFNTHTISFDINVLYNQLNGTTDPNLCETYQCIEELKSRQGYVCESNFTANEPYCELQHVCTLQPNLCRGHGTCYAHIQATFGIFNPVAACRCEDDDIFTRGGDDCTEKTMKWEILLAISAGSGGILVIILLFVIVIMCAKRKSSHSEFGDESELMFKTDYRKKRYNQEMTTDFTMAGRQTYDNPGYFDDPTLPSSQDNLINKIQNSDHSEGQKKWNPDDSANTYAYIESKLKETNYNMQIRRPQVDSKRYSDHMTDF